MKRNSARSHTTCHEFFLNFEKKASGAIMPSMYHIAKGLLSVQALPGAMMFAVGLGLMPMDDEMKTFPPFW